MSELELVHPVPPEEVPGWTRAVASTFLSPPRGEQFPARMAARRRDWRPERAWGARERGRWVATLYTHERRMTVPGPGLATNDLVVDAVTAVTVSATHRRRGLMTALAVDALQAARRRADAISALIAAEWPIYGKLGYAPATLSAQYTFHRRLTGPPPAGPEGRVLGVEPEEMLALAPGIFARARRRRAGQLDRPGSWWENMLGLSDPPLPATADTNWLIHEGPDGPDGLLAWRATRQGGMHAPLGAIEVAHLFAAGELAYRNLWAYLSGIDGVEEITLVTRPVPEPIAVRLPDSRALVTTALHDLVWLRLLDAEVALAARSYAVPGSLVLEVSDHGPVSVAGRYLLEAGEARSSCTRTSEPAELEVPQRALASILLGGYRLLALGDAFGPVRELVPGALARADLMFSTPLPPWNGTWF